MRIALFGLGYVGTVTAAGLASQGHQVCGVDVDAVKVELINSGRSPVVEPGIETLIQDGVQKGLLHATSDPVQAMDRADISILCVGTPSSPQGSADLTYLRRALEDVRAAMDRVAPPASGFHAVVVRSTVPPGTGEELVAPIFAAHPRADGWDVATAMCPEFLREGSGVADFFAPPLIVVGASDVRVNELLGRLFAFLPVEIHAIGVRSAEALKYACNAYHATKISFSNELARIFRAAKIDSREVMDVFCEDRMLNISPAYLRPGFAFGGSCLPKDLRSLLHMARINALDVPLLAATVRTNELVIADAVDRLIAGSAQVIALMGLSFKMDTDDLRESPNVDLAERLLGKGFDVRIYDPIVNPDQLMGANLRDVRARLPHLHKLLTGSPEEALRGSDAAVVSTTHPAVIRALLAAPPARVFDLSGRLGAEIEAIPGYEGIGWVA